MMPDGRGKNGTFGYGFVEPRCPTNERRRWEGNNVSTRVSIDKGRMPNLRTLHFVWTRKISNHLYVCRDHNATSIGTKTTSGSTVSTAIGKYRIHDMNFIYTRCHSILIYIYYNNLYEMSLFFNIYCNKYNAGNHHFGIHQNSPFIKIELFI